MKRAQDKLPEFRNSNSGVLPRLRIPLHIHIATVISLLLLLVATVIVVSNQVVDRNAAIEETKNAFQSLGEIMRGKIEALYGPVETAVESTADSIDLFAPDKIFYLDTVKLLAKRLSETDHIFALYYGNHGGNFVYVSNVGANVLHSEAVYRSWIITRPTQQDFDRTEYLLDKNLNVLSMEILGNNGYDPRTRPWYQTALKTPGTVQTAPYVFFETNDVGVTIARRTDKGSGVVGGDLTLQTLSAALRENKLSDGSFAIIFEDSKKILAAAEVEHVIKVEHQNDRPVAVHQALHSSDIPVYRTLARLVGNVAKESVKEIETENEKWIVWLSPLTLGHDHNAVLSLLSPSDEVFADVYERMRTNLIIALFGIATGLLASWLVANSMARPIGKLTDEAFRMRQFDLEEREPVNSRIVEVRKLSQAVQILKRSLNDFARYVPAQVVRRLVAGEMTSDIGGVRTQITVLFTDVAEFTAISETMEPMELMADISEYLAVLSQTLIENGAMIDKYIGDAVMAVWNAPVSQEKHAQMACKATLEAVAAISDLNKRRADAGKPPLHTRFGLHSGDAVVGNVGSAERMNYTALGETVNLAARLESFNKQTGTMILISETVQQEISEVHLTRIVDMMRPKGAAHPVRIYELLSDGQYGLNQIEASGHLRSWQQCYEFYTSREWARAVDAFDQHIARYPEDGAAKIFRKRAFTYIKNPPSDEWDGVFTARVK